MDYDGWKLDNNEQELLICFHCYQTKEEEELDPENIEYCKQCSKELNLKEEHENKE